MAAALVCLNAGAEEENEQEDDGGIWPVELKPELWSRLPSEILFHSVFPCLPFFFLFNLRVLSRAVCAHLSSRAFWHLWFKRSSRRSHASTPSFLLLDTFCGSFTGVDTCGSGGHRRPSKEVSRWLKGKSIRFVPSLSRPLRPPPPCSDLAWCLLPLEFTSLPSVIILFSHGGLLLLQQSQDAYFMCNPINRSCRKIPAGRGDGSIICGRLGDGMSGYSIISMGVDADLGIYCIALGVFLSRDEIWYRVYSSSSGEWKAVRARVSDHASGFLPLQHACCIRHVVLSKSTGLIMAFHMEEQVLSCAPTRFKPRIVFPNNGTVWKDTEGLKTVAFFDSQFGIWRRGYDLHSEEWRLAKVLPPEASEDMNAMEHPELGFCCVKLYDRICLSTASNSRRVYVYRLGLMTGRWSKPCPYPIPLLKCLAFQPSPDVVA